MMRVAGGAPSTGAAVIHLRGEIDLASADDLGVMLELTATGAGEELVLDLCQVTFMDRAGVRPLVRVRDRLAGRLWLRGPSDQVRLLLHLARLEETFQITGAPQNPPGEDVREPGRPTAAAADDSPAHVVAAELLGLQKAVRDRARVEQAKGLVMGTQRCSVKHS